MHCKVNAFVIISATMYDSDNKDYLLRSAAPDNLPVSLGSESRRKYPNFILLVPKNQWYSPDVMRLTAEVPPPRALLSALQASLLLPLPDFPLTSLHILFQHFFLFTNQNILRKTRKAPIRLLIGTFSFYIHTLPSTLTIKIRAFLRHAQV